MPANYTGNAANGFSPTIPLVVDSDAPAAVLWQTPEQKLLDNDAYLRAVVLTDKLLRLRPLEYASAPASEMIAAVSDVTNRQVVLVTDAGGGRLADGDHVATGGAMPSGFGSTHRIFSAARHGSTGRIVAVGTPYIGANLNAYSDDNGATWTAGGAMTGGPFSVVWDAVHSKFISSTDSLSQHVNWSADGTSWSAATTALSAPLGGLAMLSNGNAILCGASTGTQPAFEVSTDGGATFASTGGTVPSAASYSDAGWVVGNGGPLIWHIGTLSNQTVVCSSPDGIAWTRVLTQTWVANPSLNPVIYCDQDTGMLVAVSHLTNSTAGFMVSLDAGATWLGPRYLLGVTVFAHSYAVAGGRLFSCDGAGGFRASDGLWP